MEITQKQPCSGKDTTGVPAVAPSRFAGESAASIEPYPYQGYDGGREDLGPQGVPAEAGSSIRRRGGSVLDLFEFGVDYLAFAARAGLRPCAAVGRAGRSGCCRLLVDCAPDFLVRL